MSRSLTFDVSKLAQWDVVFTHMERMGLHLLMMTQEQENDQLLDGGSLGVQRKVYYRELIARFGHHLGVTWNLGEENTNTAAQRDSFASYINALDPYFHLIAVHTFPSDRTSIYTAMLGNPLISAASLQLESPSVVHAETLKWVSKSAATGSKWVVSVDELGPAGVGAVPDANDPTHSDIIHRVLWGSLLAGGAGVEWYFGYNYANDDLTCEDWRSRDQWWTLSQYAVQFVRDYLPLPLAVNCDALTSATNDYCFGKAGVAYAIFLPDGATTTITLPAGESYAVMWFNPRTGGSLVAGTVSLVGGGTGSVGRPPTQQSSDWVCLLQRSASTSPDTVTPPPTDTTTTLAVSDTTLVDANTQQDLRKMLDGGNIALDTDGVALNVRANTSGAVGSVAFVFDGVTIRVENLAPYAMAADDAGIYRKWSPPLGTHRLQVIPY
ncbi:MAG: putative collagen-binding domain-containing protein [Opitutus sp.]